MRDAGGSAHTLSAGGGRENSDSETMLTVGKETRFADRLDMMYEIKRRVKNDLKSFNLDLTETEREGCR